jgi:hypothetical protein
MENRIVDYSGQRARLTTLAKKQGDLTTPSENMREK